MRHAKEGGKGRIVQPNYSQRLPWGSRPVLTQRSAQRSRKGSPSVVSPQNQFTGAEDTIHPRRCGRSDETAGSRRWGQKRTDRQGELRQKALRCRFGNVVRCVSLAKFVGHRVFSRVQLLKYSRQVGAGQEKSWENSWEMREDVSGQRVMMRKFFAYAKHSLTTQLY